MPWDTETAKAAAAKSHVARAAKLAAKAAKTASALTPSKLKDAIFCLPNWHTAPLDEAETALGKLRVLYEEAAAIVHSRHDAANKGKPIHCCICNREIMEGRWNFRDESYVNPETKLLEPQHTCSMNCSTRYLQEQNTRKYAALAKPRT